MLAGNGADQEEAQPGALDAKDIADRDAVEALEDSLQVRSGNAEAMIGNREHHPCVALESEMHFELGSFGRILDRVVEHVEDSGAQVFRVAHHGELLRLRVYVEANG